MVLEIYNSVDRFVNSPEASGTSLRKRTREFQVDGGREDGGRCSFAGKRNGGSSGGKVQELDPSSTEVEMLFGTLIIKK